MTQLAVLQFAEHALSQGEHGGYCRQDAIGLLLEAQANYALRQYADAVNRASQAMASRSTSVIIRGGKRRHHLALGGMARVTYG